MNTFRDKYFKNKMLPLDAYYDCIISCEINSTINYRQVAEENGERKFKEQNLK